MRMQASFERRRRWIASLDRRPKLRLHAKIGRHEQGNQLIVTDYEIAYSADEPAFRVALHVSNMMLQDAGQSARGI